MAAVVLAACGAPAENTSPANTNAANANAAKPSAAAPTADTFLDMEKKANEAYARGDGQYFQDMLSDKAVMSMGKDRMGKAAIVSMIRTAKCEITDGIKLSEPQMSKINDDTYAFTYKNDTAGTCTENGRSIAMKPVRASTLWVRSGDKWQAVWHSENEIMAAASGDTRNEAKKEEPKRDEPAAADMKKDNKTAANTNTPNNANITANANAAAPPPASLTPSANTDALTKIHAAGWEAFRNKDAKWFEDHISAGFAGVNPVGGYMANKADTIKEWTGGGTMKCEGITKTNFTDAFAQAVSPTVEILFGKGNSDGTCNGQKNGDLWHTAVYVKEGDAWKLAYLFESPAV